MTNDSLNDSTRKDDKEFLVICLKGMEPEFNADAADYILDGLAGYGAMEPVSCDDEGCPHYNTPHSHGKASEQPDD